MPGMHLPLLDQMMVGIAVQSMADLAQTFSYAIAFVPAAAIYWTMIDQ
jgi:hypothetical protein